MNYVQKNVFLLFLVTALVALALAGTVAAGGTNSSTGWTWDDSGAVESPDGTVVSPDGWTWDDGASLAAPSGWTWDDGGAMPSTDG
jgi:hypothetical protein